MAVRRRDDGGGVQKDAASSGSPMAPPPPVAPDLTVADAEVLDCSVCFLPLKPPIFQCGVGHMVCAQCRGKLMGAGKCHVCRVALGAGGYRRCHGMERVVDSVRGPCPNVRYGCAATPVYHGRDEHLQACPHAPCHCPGEAFGFAGSTAALLDHIKAAHGWPCVTKVGDYRDFCTLRFGFNFLLAVVADCSTRNKMPRQGATATVQCLLLLNVVRQPFGRTISVVWISPHAGATAVRGVEMECSLVYQQCQRLPVNNDDHGHGGNKAIDHQQQSTFRVEITNLSNGLPNPDACFQFVLPNSVVADHDGDDDGIRVLVSSIVIK